MKKRLLFFIFLISCANINAQTEEAWVYLKDKPSQSTYISSPLSMLSQRALDRRNRYNIELDSKDVPVEGNYISEIKNSTGITVKAISKWLNALHIQGTQIDILNLSSFDFVDKIDFADTSLNSSAKTNKQQKVDQQKNKLEITTDFNYGNAANQIEMLKGEVLHQNNYTGKGMQIAVIDAGFPNVDVYDAFKRIRDNNQILGGYDFVNRKEEFYTGSYHGMAVLSTISGYIENEFIGTAPDAEFYLFITEDANNETPLEESLWVEAAEKADSLGVDVINTSLGYTTFDNPNYDYSYNDLDGKTSYISRGAEIAFSRGMILVNSAGNSGNKSWYYINTPADASSVLSIGAVNAEGEIAGFSSFGPTSDDRIKPDVCAQGAGVYIINSSGNIATSNGTSFSSPILAGTITCLWQAFPTKSNTEIVKLVKESGHLFLNPTNQEGYGIPNFKKVYDLLSITIDDLDGDGVPNNLDLCPDTPIGTVVNENGCLLLSSDNFSIEVFGETCPDKNNGEINISAKDTFNYTAIINGMDYSFTNNTLNLEDLEPGNYDVCILISEQNYEQCYSIYVNEGITISGKASVSSKGISIELDQGTSPFTVFVNGKEEMKTTNSKFELAINHGDLVQVKSSIDCEGVFLKEIVLESSIGIYPIPAENEIRFTFPIEINEIEVDIINLLGQTISKRKINKNKPILDISYLKKGMFLVKTRYNNKVETIKILKH